MTSLRYFFNPNTVYRLPRLILSSHHRYLSTSNDNKTAEAQPEIGPSAPELQLNNLTGDYERK